MSSVDVQRTLEASKVYKEGDPFTMCDVKRMASGSKRKQVSDGQCKSAVYAMLRDGRLAEKDGYYYHPKMTSVLLAKKWDRHVCRQLGIKEAVC